MKLLRMKNLWLLATLLTPGAALTPLGVLQTYPELSSFYGRINASPTATSILETANNFTLFAPNNNAIEKFLSGNSTALTEEFLVATLQYSLLQGIYPSLSFSNISQFVPTSLYNGTYSNVTGGQRVELVLGSDNRPQVLSGNTTISTAPSTGVVCTGGIVHIVDEVLRLPVPAVLEISAANLEYTISILAAGNFLDTSNSNYVNGILEVPDVTYFIPNSANALANAATLVKNSSAEELQAIFKYHVVQGVIAYSPSLTNGTEFTTQQGDSVTVNVQGNETYINGAKVIATDYLVANGVVHIIDDLLNRFNKSGPPPPTEPKTTSSSTSATPTPTSTPSPTSNSAESTTSTPEPEPASKSGGLSQGAKIGIGVGVSIVGLLALAVLAGFFLRSRKQNHEQRDSGSWDDQRSSGVPDTMGKFYVKRGTIHRQEDGLQETGMHDAYTHPRDMEDVNTGNSGPYFGGPTSGGPDIPPRSPSRAIRGNEF